LAILLYFIRVEKNMAENKLRRYIYLVVMFIFILAILFFFNENAKAYEGGTVYASIERFTLGEGYLVEPVTVSFEKGESYADIFEKLANSNHLTYTADKTSRSGKVTYFYLRSIDKADTGALDIPDIIMNMDPIDYGGVKIYPPTNTKNDGNEDAFPSLGEFAYCSLSGWYYLVNNKNPGIGFAGLEPKDGDVVRFQFTLFGIGSDVESKDLPNRDLITKRLALMNANKKELVKYGYQDCYNNALKIVRDFDSDQSAMDRAYGSLPTEARIKACKDAYNVEILIDSLGTVTLEKESKITAIRKSYNSLSQDAKTLISSLKLSVLANAEKRLNDLKQAKNTTEVKKTTVNYIPAKAILTKVRSGKKKAVLKWKKVSSASGYQIYMSVKKKKGFKKITTIKKVSKITYTRKKLKSKKKYFFKVRAYRKVGNKTYYGKFSAVKSVKIK